MRKGNGNGRSDDQWVMVDDNGQRTLFQLVEAATGPDAVRLASELPARGIVIDVALPALPPLDATAASRRRPPRSRLIVLKVRTVAGEAADHRVRIMRAQPELLPSDAASPD